MMGAFVGGLLLFLLGLLIAVLGGTAAGLMVMGGGLVVSGIGGSVSLTVRYTIISGSSGVVLILVGAFFDYISKSI